jgi:PAS domain S-box-containing protein
MVGEEKEASPESLQFGVFEQASIGVVLGNDQGLMLRCNQAMAALLGYERHQLEGRSWLSVTHREDAALSSDALRTLRDGAAPDLRVRKRYVRKDGGTVWADVSFSRLPSTQGVLTLAFVQDVTEGVLAAQAAKASAERLNLILELASDGVWEWDLDAARLDVSPGWRAVTGWPQDAPEPDAVAWQAILHPEDAERVGGTFARLMAGELRSFSLEYRIRTPSGVRYVLDRGRVLRIGPDRKPRHLIGTVRDVSELRLAQETLHQAQKLDSLGRLAGSVAHDFNNLLTAVMGNVALARAEATGAVAEALDQIESASTSAAALTARLLAFCRKQPLVPQVVHLGELLGKAQVMWSRALGPRYALGLEIHATEARVLVDPSRAEQALINLLLNARDAMPDGGRIAVEVTLERSPPLRKALATEGPFVVVSVSDEGRGLTDEERSHLFEPFFTTKSRGTGLGLSTVYGLMEQLGGCVDVSSVANEGSTFRLFFPLHVEQPHRVEPVATPDRWVRGKEHVVLVDDEAAVRSVVQRSLCSLGYRVTAFDGANAALDALAELGVIDLLITDLVMPLVSGQELARRARLERPRLRVLFISGYSPDFASSTGAWDERARFLAKPFLPSELAKTVRELLALDA